MPTLHFDNYPSQNRQYFQFVTKVKQLLTNINIFLKWVEILILPCFFLFSLFFAFNLKPECISGLCNINWLDFNFGLLKWQYSDTLFNLIADFAMPFLTINGIVRIGLTFWINKKDGNFEWFFYLGLLGFILCYYFLSFNFESFAYIHAPGNKVFEESSIVEIILGGLVLSGFLVFRDKYNWDRASFFTKFRLLFYSIHLIICIVNVNFGIIFFVLSLPFQVMVDLRRQNHIHYNDPIWKQS